jgi:hypothetical protein
VRFFATAGKSFHSVTLQTRFSCSAVRNLQGVGRERWPDKIRRHQAYTDALTARGVTCVMGHFKKKDRRCHSCKSAWVAHEERETDVSIGITMLNDAYKGL